MQNLIKFKNDLVCTKGSGEIVKEANFLLYEQKSALSTNQA